MLRSNFLELTGEQREVICASNPSFSSIVRDWYGKERSPFDVVTRDDWWIPPDGYHHEPDELAHRDLEVPVNSLAEVSTSLASAAYPARRQPLRVADLCLLFLHEPGRIEVVRTIFVMQGCLTAESCPIAVLVRERQIAEGMCFTDAFKTVLDAVKKIAASTGQREVSEQLLDWIEENFSSWVTQFVLELIRWQLPRDQLQAKGHDNVQ